MKLRRTQPITRSTLIRTQTALSEYPTQPNPIAPRIHSRAFFFFIFKKIKISKIYVWFEIFQKYPRSPPNRATDPKCNFFSSNLQRGPWPKKRGLSPPTPMGDRGLSPTPGATGPCRWATGPCRPPEGRPPLSTLYTFLSEQLPKRATEISKSQQELADWLVSNVVSTSSVR